MNTPTLHDAGPSHKKPRLARWIIAIGLSAGTTLMAATAAPAAAPWMRISEAVDYLRAVAPTHAVPIHQAIVEPSARGIYYGRLTELTDTDFQVLEPENGRAF